jgi:hypothetical protein
MTDELTHWNGVSIAKMSRAELVQTIQHLNRLLDEQVASHQRTIDVFGKTIQRAAAPA